MDKVEKMGESKGTKVEGVIFASTAERMNGDTTGEFVTPAALFALTAIHNSC